MSYISDILYWISTGLLVPVIVLLIVFFLRSLLLVGSFFGQYLSMRKTGFTLKQEFKKLTVDNLDEFEKVLPKNNASLSVSYIRRMLEARDNQPQVEFIMSEFEIAADKDLGISKTMTKMGPMLGLMGTLIPMGPALVGLAAGDIASMAYNMQVAFATTVVGLFVSAVGFITQQVKQRWYLQDMVNMEYLSEVQKEKRA